MIKYFSKFSFVLSQKRQFFRYIFLRKYFKNHNIGPWSQSYKLELRKAWRVGLIPGANTDDRELRMELKTFFFFYLE
jgi:hypothetical protein